MQPSVQMILRSSARAVMADLAVGSPQLGALMDFNSDRGVGLGVGTGAANKPGSIDATAPCGSILSRGQRRTTSAVGLELSDERGGDTASPRLHVHSYHGSGRTRLGSTQPHRRMDRTDRRQPHQPRPEPPPARAEPHHDACKRTSYRRILSGERRAARVRVRLSASSRTAVDPCGGPSAPGRAVIESVNIQFVAAE
jgi:hypothetical protein